MGQERRRETGVRLILVYKIGKAAAWLLLATALGLLATTGRLGHFRALAATLREHVASRWSLLLADWLLRALSPRGVRLVELGLVTDGLLTALEGWALWRGHRWGAWLVLLASTAPLPFEVYELGRHPSLWRLALLLANAAVVAYLARWLRRHHRGEVP
jgi:uncharacterized membrane protein (DUF2068 family)